MAEIWSSVMIDGYPTIAEFIQPEKSEQSSNNLMSKDIPTLVFHPCENESILHPNSEMPRFSLLFAPEKFLFLSNSDKVFTTTYTSQSVRRRIKSARIKIRS